MGFNFFSKMNLFTKFCVVKTLFETITNIQNV